MANSVEYELNLKDNFSSPLNEAKGSAEGFHESVMHIIEALGLLEVAHEALDFLKESFHEYDEHQVAIASLTQMYNNNSQSVGISIDKMKELAEVQQKLTGIHAEDTFAAEQNLLKFRELRIGYQDLVPVIEDFAKATGSDAAEAANTMGRALENPQRAMRLLMQAGVSPEQIQSIENLQKMGHVAQAQQQIFEILKEKYHGVARAMFEASPAAQMSIQMKELREQFGEIEESLLRKLMPAITGVFEYLHHTIDYLKEHKEAVKEVINVVGILAAGFVVYRTILISISAWEKIVAIAMAAKNTVMELGVGYSMALAEGYNVLEAAQWALNAAMDANPIGVVILALTALSALVYEVYKHWDQLKSGFIAGMENFKLLGIVIWDNLITPLQIAYYSIKKLWDELHGDHRAAEIDNLEILIATAKKAEDKIEYIKSLQRIKAQNDSFEKKGEKGEDGKIGKTTMLPDIVMPPKSDKVAGSSQVTINVTIHKMTGIEKFISTTIKGAQVAGENVEKMLIAAIDQFQASADT